MKLFAFYPNGHGPESFFVMAESLEQAKAQVQQFHSMYKYIDYPILKPVEDGYCIGETEYTIEEYSENQVAFNNND